MKKIFHWVYEHTEGFLMVVFTLMLVTDVLLGILARYVQFEVVFAEELGKYLFIWLCAIGISAAAKDHQHIRLDFFADALRLPPRWTWLLSQSLFLIFSLFFGYWGLQLTLMHFGMNKSAMGFSFPMFVFTAALPFGFFLTSLRLIIDIVRTMKEGEPKRPIHPENLKS
jgi:TRAP-type C4-dicarboxylate transport system permease small subunit